MESKNEKNIDQRFLARIVIEAETPLSVKSGEGSFYTDALVMKDVNGLPYIPGSSLAGVMRSGWKLFEKEDNALFGFQGAGNEGEGSRVVFTEARILNSEGVVMDGLQENAFTDPLLAHFHELPIRQHVRINSFGTTVEKGKFDEQVVYAGARFCFEMEMIGTSEDEGKFQRLISVLQNPAFRLGGGTRKGFGKVKVVDIKYAQLALNDAAYLTKSSNLEESKRWYEKHQSLGISKSSDTKGGWLVYKLKLKPDAFCLFGSGYGDDEADMTPVREDKVEWKDGKGSMNGSCYLVPATSVKGAIAHRVAYHYNLRCKKYADTMGSPKEKEMENCIGCGNLAVRSLFGMEGANEQEQLRGNVLLSDLFLDAGSATEKILNHVAIDRFTGAPIDGALFSEKTLYLKEMDLVLEIMVDANRVRKQVGKEEIYNDVIGSLEAALKDICHGLLPLGGGVNRGNGVFSGEMTKEGGKNNE